MQPEFDEFDAGILSERQTARRNLSGPQVGDFLVREADGLLARITHVWDDGVQTTKWSETGEGGSFHLGSSGRMSYSGGLEPSIPRDHLKKVSRPIPAKGRAWFFHHGQSRAHNGVQCEFFVTTWEYKENRQPQSIDDYIPLLREGQKFDGTTHSLGWMDGDVMRILYTSGQTREDYEAQEGIKLIEYSWDDYLAMSAEYMNGLKTKPTECGKDHYWEMLECLPPCRWDGNVFHVSERLQGKLVNWYFEKDGKYFGFVDDEDISNDDLRKIIDAA